MNGREKADIFLERLKADSAEYKELESSNYNLEETKNAIRSLMNIRMPGDLSDGLVESQDSYLQEELKAKGIVKIENIPTIKEAYNSKSPCAEKISLWQGDITRLEAGAIVNAANSQLLGCFVPCHRCIDNAIHSAAGLQLREECNCIMSHRRLKYGRKYAEPTGTATLTLGYNLPSKYVIHTVGPIVNGRLNERLCQDLRKCYENVLKCCLEHNIRSLAFCCISTGEFHFPKDKAAEIAWKSVTAFLDKHSDRMERIIFNVFKDSDRSIYKKFLM